jgi:long-chain acyl-CoA synthetase
MQQPTRLFDFPRYQLQNNPLELMMSMPNGGNRINYSTESFIEAVDRVGRGLIAMGLEVGEKVALISHNNRCEWNIMDHGIMSAGGINVPIYPTMTEADYEYILNHSESKYCAVSNQDLYDKVMSIKDKVPTLQGVFVFERASNGAHWSEITEAGSDAQQAELDNRMNSVKPEDLATIIYTSGTTGTPKGVMLSHQNIVQNILHSIPRIPPVLLNQEYRVLSFLPVCHIFERMLHYLYMYIGANIYFAESLETIKEDLGHAQPTVFTAVPRLLEKFYDGIVQKGRAAGGVKAAIFNWALALALEWEPDGQNGGFYEWKLGIARKLVFSKVKTALGLDNIRAVACGSAALAPRLARFFNAAGIPVYEGYGLTETSPVVTVNSDVEPGLMRIGYVGKLIEGVDVKFANDGEIMVKGHNIMMGYFKEPEKTAEVMTDDWFHTGDIGVFDNGFLKITDRKKEMFKTSGGKYVAPQLLENALKASLFIEQVMVVGDGQKFPGAIVVPNAEAVEEWCKRKNHPFPGMEGIRNDKRIADRIQKDVDSLMEPFAKWEKIKAIRILPQMFSIENGELTPTLKLKRKPIKAHYQDEIDALYA